LHIKLDELIFVTEKARNKLLDLEGLDDRELELLSPREGVSAAEASRAQTISAWGFQGEGQTTLESFEALLSTGCGPG
jgi:low affinity Fe/Cu permease